MTAKASSNSLAQFPPPQRTAFRRALLAWYHQSGRALPWRKTADAYQIWLSEIMLQQTTVAAVMPYFERFLAAFPTVNQLAVADEEAVLRLWEGLGYYSRARNLRKAAQRVVAEFGGRLPSSVNELRSLPGIGRYTAGAIASFAFDARAPIVEANTLRLYCRLMGLAGDPKTAANQRTLWEFAEAVLPKSGAGSGETNQALMELGSLICTPKSPHCEECPVGAWCVARREGTTAQIPQPTVRPEVTSVVEWGVAIRDGDAIRLRKRQPGERWAGLWDFPRWSAEEVGATQLADGSAGDAEFARIAHVLQELIRRDLGLMTRVVRPLGEIRYSVTRYRMTLNCLEAERLGAARDESVIDNCWVKRDDLSTLPLSVAGRKLANRLIDPHRSTNDVHV